MNVQKEKVEGSAIRRSNYQCLTLCNELGVDLLHDILDQQVGCNSGLGLVILSLFAVEPDGIVPNPM